MKNRQIALMIVLALLLTGCGAGAGKANGFGGGTMAVEMTEQEKDLLCTVFTSQQQQKYVREGRLIEDQERMLNQMRAIIEWLQKKYPSHAFCITSIDPGNPDNPGISYAFTADGGEALYYVSAPGTDSRDFRESYYAALLATPCTERFQQLLAERGLPVAALEMTFLGLAGDEVTEQTGAEVFLAMNEQVSRRTTVFLQGDKAALQTARAALEELGYGGGYWLFASERFQPEMSAEACWDIKRSDGAVAADSFLLGA